MQPTDIFLRQLNNTNRQIGWEELNQLKKDILWVFDENGKELHNAYIPDYSFLLPYWEYPTISGGEFFSTEEKKFYVDGALIIVICMISEYIDIPAGGQLVFGNTKIADISAYIKKFDPVSENQIKLRDIALLGLSVVKDITHEDIAKNEEFEHPDVHKFYSHLPWVSETFVDPYYKMKTN